MARRREKDRKYGRGGKELTGCVCVCVCEISERPKRGWRGENERDGCFSTQGQAIGEENIYVGANEKSAGRV